MNRFLYDQNKHKAQMFFCQRCFHGFAKSENLLKHKERSQKFPEQNTDMVNEKIQFKNIYKTEEALFRVYADFESVKKKSPSSVVSKQK